MEVFSTANSKRKGFRRFSEPGSLALWKSGPLALPLTILNHHSSPGERGSGPRISIIANTPVDHKGGSSAFIDDYFRWVMRLSADENLRRLQEDNIPRIEQWAKQTGSYFAAEKTELIHLTRKKNKLSKGQLIIQGTTIKASTTAKLLGVVFDNELRWKPHVQQVLKRATRVNTALGGLRYLRPGQMRQLYQACVTPIVDYASMVWHSPTKDKMHLRALNTVQRSALIRILSAFKSVATATMEVELFTLPTRLRLRQRAQITIVNLLTLPWDHPIQGKLPAFKEIDINPDREKARKNAASLLANPHQVVYSDASGHDNHLGAAAVVLDRNQNIVASRKTAIGSMAHWSIHIAELIGVYYAISLALKIFHQNGQSTRPGAGEAITILSNSKSAIQAIKNPRNTSRQRVIEAINQSAYELDSRGIPLRLQWIPGHCDDLGNDAADRLAKAAEPTYGELIPSSRPSVPAGYTNRHSWLATHGKALRHREDNKCECGAKETVVHILIDCPRLTTERQRLRKEAGDAFGNVSLMLGAKGQGITSSSAPGGILDAVLDFAEASQRTQGKGRPQAPRRGIKFARKKCDDDYSGCNLHIARVARGQGK
ncbi:conserved hypothetical protein [Talaromyces stipitatus ATCC 10500]|uniref:RNase H type-1 domain-containing protein n=1 Tax=Talaromyces stipitatus (strain ATCC 10500 / CBS 375.48 / QM 6759 / NRRL 1006) TaxID=441959 RepID=B8MUY1_TALSN|nr:uncharacterized protein TSTA_110020 [Talaromyces stipitatus ATCC 10500]EED11822.1 conserved hypothetical protein [Talaromyces stipitatus ATCC 10500]